MDNELRLAATIAVAALATEGVSRLGSGIYAEAATYGAGEKVEGVVVKPGEVEVHVVLSYPLLAPVPELAEEVKQNVNPLAKGREVMVVVEDIEVGRG